MMARIVVEAESNMTEFTQPRRRQQRRLSIAETICESIAHAAEDLHMGAIAVFTETGSTAILISKYRPQAEIYAFCRDLPVCNRLNLLWGVKPVLRQRALTAEEMLYAAEQELVSAWPGKDRGCAWSGGRHADGIRFHQFHAPAPGDSGRRTWDFPAEAAWEEKRGPLKACLPKDQFQVSSSQFSVDILRVLPFLISQ